MAAGKFITFEGGEGSGKSTQARLLAQGLRGAGLDVVLTREPGGTPFAEQVRSLILSRDTAAHGPKAEALLFFAARSDHVETLIRPSLASGKWVICDRFTDSTRVYQGLAGALSLAAVDTLDALVVGSTQPDLTFILDIDPAVGLARAQERQGVAEGMHRGADPYEQRGLEFHTRLRTGYLRIARADPTRCVLVEAGGSRDTVEGLILAAVLDRWQPLLRERAP